MKNNSSFTFFNSNVMRSGGDYDSNVSAFLFDQNDKKNTWNLNGKLAISKYWMDEENTKPGLSGSLGFGKISGRFTFRIFNEYSDNRYSHNDLGYFTNNNFINNNLYVSYRIIKPKGWYNRCLLYTSHGRMSEEWLRDLAPLGTGEIKEFLTIAPWLIVVFKKAYDLEGHEKRKNYYVSESVGIACGILLTAIHHAGLVALTHTPSPMNFLKKILNRPENESPYLLIPVGYGADEAMVPDICLLYTSRCV